MRLRDNDKITNTIKQSGLTLGNCLHRFQKMKEMDLLLIIQLRDLPLWSTGWSLKMGSPELKPEWLQLAKAGAVEEMKHSPETLGRKMDERYTLCVPVLPNHWMYREASWHSVQSLSHVRLCSISWIAACQASLSITNSQSLLKHVSIESVMLSSHLILCHPLLILPSIFPSFRIFPNETVLCIRWPKYWSFSFSISPSNEYSGLVSFRMDWFDLLAVQGTPKYLFQHQVQKHQFFGTQLSS